MKESLVIDNDRILVEQSDQICPVDYHSFDVVSYHYQKDNLSMNVRAKRKRIDRLNEKIGSITLFE